MKTDPSNFPLSVNGNYILPLAQAKTYRVILAWPFNSGALRLLFPLPRLFFP